MAAAEREDPLATLATLSGRGPIYRRVLAPLMMYAGAVGVISAVLAERQHIRASGSFALYWLCAAAVVLVGVALLLRLRAWRARQGLVSPQVRWVFYAVAPMLVFGVALGVAEILWPQAGDEALFQSRPRPVIARLIASWLLCYGAALDAVGSVAERGLRVLGWCVLLCGLTLLAAAHLPGIVARLPAPPDRYAHWLMGLCFGAGHWMYGLYLYFTEEPEAT